ncbi:FAD-binding oxidoreductase [Sinorhizobium meliloti]|uniref:FAD-binding oxidoreductase n=1 Tax=Rhizobium meliloti TaxID=382 RepID=UPI00398D1A0E
MTNQDVISALKAELGGIVLSGSDIPVRNEGDWTSQSGTRPLAVVRPETTGSVAAVLRICSKYYVSVVPQGGLTGLAGGAQPTSDCVVISLERLVGIDEIDRSAHTMTVRAGTTLEAVQRAAEDAGLYFAVDLGARGSCTIGGNIATNAGGNRVIRYGMMRESVLGIEAVLPDGSVLSSLNKMIKNNAGYDLKQLFIGSEGTLGVVTRAVLKLMPLPLSTSTAVCGVKDYEAVLRLLDNARQNLGSSLSAFELMWPDFFDLATAEVPGIRRPIQGDHDFYVLVEAQGANPNTDQEAFETWLGGALEAGIVEDAVVAQSLSEAQAFWNVRDAGSEFKAIIGSSVSFDIGLPVGAIGEYVQRCRSVLASELPGCISFYFGHIADGNIHVMACIPSASEQPVDCIDEIVYRLVKEYSGTVSAEHGIGIRKRAYLPLTRNDDEIALMKVLKKALDPRNILNPGKVFC